MAPSKVRIRSSMFRLGIFGTWDDTWRTQNIDNTILKFHFILREYPLECQNDIGKRSYYQNLLYGLMDPCQNPQSDLVVHRNHFDISLLCSFYNHHIFRFRNFNETVCYKYDKYLDYDTIWYIKKLNLYVA